MRTIRLHPVPEAEHDCPHCRQSLLVLGWHIPGMRNLADLRCSVCDRRFYGDLSAGQALYSPMLLDRDTGVVHDKHGVAWFADWLRDSYSHRSDEQVSFVVERRRPITRPVVLLNCLDTLYGHSLLKLLNAQHHLEGEVDLVLIVPSFLRWMIPEGVAEVWVVGLPLQRGTEWNDWIDREVHSRLDPLPAVNLSHALSHPKPADYQIARFTGVEPFPLDQWEARLNRPTVTFIWRDDRMWRVPEATNNPTRWLRRSSSSGIDQQQKLVVALAEELRSEWPTLDFAIAGLSEAERVDGLPEWIEDLRSPTMDEARERRYCERYAASHVVVGVHGSNMLLPTAHAGGLVELIGPERWGNFTQDVLFRDTGDSREMLFRYRFMPTSTTPPEMALLISQLLKGRESFRNLMT